MKNYNYNGMNAQDIANKIIAIEEAYLTIDFDALSFEEKCNYVAHHNGIYHPLYKKGRSADELAVLLLPELRYRGNYGDEKALYFLAVLDSDIAHRSDGQRSMIERAMECGSVNAQAYFASWFCRDEEMKANILEELLYRHFGGEVAEEDEKVLYDCYCMLANCAQTEEVHEHYKALADDLALKFVLKGEYHSLIHLCTKNRLLRDPKTKNFIFDAETIFWKTVNFIVESYFYAKWHINSSDNLGIGLIRGIGCDPDFERAKHFYLDVYFRKPFDRAKMLEVSGISDTESLIEAEQGFKQDVNNGDVEGYWKLILLGILQNDTEMVEQICDEAIKKHPNDLMKIMPKAYTKLLNAK